MFEQTWHFHERGLTEVGSAAFGEPSASETAALALYESLRPGDSSASVTETAGVTVVLMYVFGRCADVDLYLLYG